MADAGKVSLRPRGRFDITATYERLDFVKFNTGCYVALQTTTGNLPTDTTNFMNLIDFDIANMSQIGLVKPDGESTTIDADGTLHAHAVGNVTSFNGRVGEVFPQTSDYTAAQVAYDNTDSSLSANNTKSALDELDAEKTDTTVIGPKETGASASRAYAIGEHFILNGSFCTAKTAIAQGEAFTLNTNYTAENVGTRMAALENIIFPTITLSFGNFDSKLSTHTASAIRVGNIVNLKIVVKINGSINFNIYNSMIFVNGISIYRAATTIGYLEAMGYPIDFNIAPYEEGKITFQSIPNDTVGTITSGYIHIGTTLICR